jgi:hypothetical protein
MRAAWALPPSRPPPRVPLAALLARTAAGVVGAQRSLDERARESILRWQDEGIWPAAFAWTRVRVTLPVAFGLEGRQPRPHVSPARDASALVCLGIRYCPRDQETERLAGVE